MVMCDDFNSSHLQECKLDTMRDACMLLHHVMVDNCGFGVAGHPVTVTQRMQLSTSVTSTPLMAETVYLLVFITLRPLSRSPCTYLQVRVTYVILKLEMQR